MKPTIKEVTNEIADQLLKCRLNGIHAFDNVPEGVFSLVSVAAWTARDSASQNNLIVITQSNSMARNIFIELENFLENDRVVYLPSFESIPYDYSSLSTDISIDRIRALYSIINRTRPKLIVTSIGNMIRKIPKREYLESLQLTITKNMILAPNKLCLALVNSGYKRQPQVQGPGDFSLRGDILDIFTACSNKPCRLEYFDDEIEKIREFDAISQVSIQDIDEFLIPPACEFVLNQTESNNLLLKMQKSPLQMPQWYDQARENSKNISLNQYDHAGLHDLIVFEKKLYPFTEFFSAQPEIILFNPGKLFENASRIQYEYTRSFNELNQNHICPDVTELIGDFHNDICHWKNGENHITYIFNAPRFKNELPADLQLTDEHALPLTTSSINGNNPDEMDTTTSELDDKDAFDPFYQIPSIPNPFGCSRLEGFTGKISQIRQKLVDLAIQGTQVFITSPYESQVMRISRIFSSERELEIVVQKSSTIADKSAANNNNVKENSNTKGKPRINVLMSPISSGFIFKEKDILFLTDIEFFGKSYKRKSKFKKLSSAPIDSFLDLKEGDFIVHVNHGVGRFVKLEKIKAAGRERDFLILEYAGEDRLYVPLDQISLVQRYIAPTEKPRLDNLGKKTFKKKRDQVQKKIEEFAEDLIRLYAIRMSRQGYQFPADTVWQEEFESEFPYDETPDQILAIEAVKNDMEALRPMDRLICGDVGFGKTEIAIRAAFKATMAGRQVALIAPTTILAMQHHKNISDRFASYPISVDWLSRFRTGAQSKDIKNRLMKGELDLVIGTHSLLSNSIHIKNLGLLIVDEEQRFGVKHKEAIKKMRKLVDVMTLSATPIPRTLHMSMIGIRDLSIIQTPPAERRPVQTYVIEDNDTLIRQAISREIQRGGQVFYLHNRVQTIESLAIRLQQLLPDITIDTLHGQLDEDEIEDKLLRFVGKKFDVLVTTTIIENGIDMPNVNTLIVDRADTFGLSQLYQIRGRVGRSDRQAYAYFLYNPGRALTETASRRLNTILEYQELGSGFKVAMRDLEIRGAGNMLGKEQSGQIVEVGYEMYINLLEEAVKRLRGEDTDQDHRCALNLKTDFYIPEEYIVDTRQRVSFYKRFEGASSEIEVNMLAEEMQDRYGKMPRAALVFVEVEKIRAMSSLIGFEKVYENESGTIEMAAGPGIRVDIQHLIYCIQSIPGLSMKPGNTGVLRWSGQNDNKLEAFCDILRKIVEPLAQESLEHASDSSRKGIGVSNLS